MPAPYLATLADKYGIAMSTLEKYWKEAKKVIQDYGKYDTNDDKKWGTIVNIFKNKINKHIPGVNESIINFKKYIQLESDMNNFKTLLDEGRKGSGVVGWGEKNQKDNNKNEAIDVIIHNLVTSPDFIHKKESVTPSANGFKFTWKGKKYTCVIK